ncbi:efflux RND transporter periplasmic adaptor subunit [Hydrocarboniphaga effusa]|uniref:efflux RND transporter periplasmic adaptor subunit n=1 Tax=Hydrocarboniphaga effusa TaxID=243629 RepID=UPI00398BEFE5
MNMIRTAVPVLLGLALLSGCKADSKAEEKKEEAAIPVEVATVTLGTIDAAYRGTATLEAENEATVLSKQSGTVEQVLVEEGDRVRAGQLLARLESDKLRFERARAQADVDRLEQDFTRLKSVYQRNLVSREAYDKTQYELSAARAAADLASLALRESEVRAPFDGIVSARYIKRGNLIQPNAQAFRITQMDRLRAAVYVPERDIHKLKTEHLVKLTVDAWPGKVFTGAVLLINPVIDASTGTVKVTVNIDAKQSELRPGMFARTEILYDHREQALLIPRDAVITEDAAESVYVVASDHARRRVVRIGYGDAGNFEVLEGLKAGEQVVTTGQASLKDGAKVQVVTPLKDEPAAEAAPAAAAQEG